MKIVLPAVAALAILSGCTRARVTTEIKSGASFTRTVAFTSPEPAKNQMNMGGNIEDQFVLPGSGWKSNKETNDSHITTSFERVFPAGAPVKGDLTIKGDDGKPVLVNEVSVTRLAPRRYEYRETLRWTGTRPVGFRLKPADYARIKAALPPELATDENARALSEKVAALSIPMLFGPRRPAADHGPAASRPGGAAAEPAHGRSADEGSGRSVRRKDDPGAAPRSGSTDDPNLGCARPDVGARSVVRPPSSGKGGGLTPLMFVVKTPGKIVSSNGEWDEVAGELFWGLFPPAAALKPVVMTAVIEVDQN